jgi:hypothetical protein
MTTTRPVFRIAMRGAATNEAVTMGTVCGR